MNIGKTTMEYLYKIGAGSRTKQRLCLPVVVTMLLFGSTASADSDFHITILNKAGEKVSLVFWGASGWSSATNPVKMFTGSDGDAGTADFDPFPGLGGTYDVGHARKGVSALLRGVLWINHNTSLFNKDDARLGLETTVMPRRFLQPRGGYSSSHPFQLVPEFFGNDSDLFVTILDNKHFAWAGILLHNAANDTGKEDWTNTCRSLIYSYYYKYAFRGFLFNPPHGGWYVHSGGGSDDLLWAALAAIGYKELSVKYRNKESMRADVYTHRNLLNGGDSNRRFTKPYTDINTLKSWYAYLDLSGYYYAGIVIPDEWYGIPWKDHSGDVNYKSPLDDQRDSSQHTGLNFRASISNSLFWLYAARLLKHRDELGLGNPEVELLEDTIGNEYGLFFEDHDDLYVCRSNANDPDPAHPVDRIGLIEDGARYPWLQFVDGHSDTPKWEKWRDDYNTWTYNTGTVLAALGESYLADPSTDRADELLIENGLDLANAALDRLAWKTDENAPKGVVCEIENEVRGDPWNNDKIIFKGIFTLFIGDFAEALHDAIVNGHIADTDMEKAKTCYKRISGVIRGTSNFLAQEWGLTPPAPWVRKNSPYLNNHKDMAASNSITQGSAAAAHVTAGRLVEWDKDLVDRKLITDPDEYLIYQFTAGAL